MAKQQEHPEAGDESVNPETAEVKGDKDVTQSDEDETFLAGISQDNAVLLLAAAEEAGLDQGVVTVNHDKGGFNAPADVIAKAKSGDKSENKDEE